MTTVYRCRADKLGVKNIIIAHIIDEMHACEKEAQEGETGPNVYARELWDLGESKLA